MTPHLGSRLRIHEQETHGGLLLSSRATLGTIAPPREQRRLAVVENGEFRGMPALRREALQRRLLAIADVLGAALSLWVVLTLPGSGDTPGLAALLGMPLIVIVFKIAGLYDRDQLRVMKSTLDEVPLLAQLIGLYALMFAIAQPLLVDGTIGGAQLAALWATSLVGIASARILVRRIGGRAIPIERCLVIGEVSRADRIRAKFESSRARAVVVATFPLEAG